jgi:nucleotide-binding universal stress UspA family protein
MLKRVLIPVSFHEKPEKIDGMCALLRSIGTTQAVLLHVGSNNRGAGKQNRRRLEKIAARVQEAGLETEEIVRPGSVQIVVVRTAEERGVDFIAFAFRRRSILQRAILGSTVKDVIRQSDLPVFVYKERTRWMSPDEKFRAMYATSLQFGDDIILSYIRDKQFKADEIVFLHVGRRAPDPWVERKRQEEVEEKLRELRRNCGLGEEDSRHIAVLGSARRQIVKVARRIPADLMLLGKADTVIGMGQVLGSTTEEVSYNVGCSVLIIPREIEERTGGRK